MVIVAVLERGDGGAHLLDVPEDAAVNGLFLERPVEALGDAVGLRLGNEGEARCDAPELDLVEEVVGGLLRALVHAQRQAASGVGAGGAPEFEVAYLGVAVIDQCAQARLVDGCGGDAKVLQ